MLFTTSCCVAVVYCVFHHANTFPEVQQANRLSTNVSSAFLTQPLQREHARTHTHTHTQGHDAGCGSEEGADLNVGEQHGIRTAREHMTCDVTRFYVHGRCDSKQTLGD